MASGIGVNQECIDKFNEIKMQKSFKYVLMHIENEKEIKVTKCGAKDATFQNFFDDLMEARKNGHGRYALYDHIMSDSGNNKLLFILWNPDDIPVKNRMLYASSKEALKKKFPGVQRELQANEVEEITEQEIESKLK